MDMGSMRRTVKKTDELEQQLGEASALYLLMMLVLLVAGGYAEYFHNAGIRMLSRQALQIDATRR